VQSPDNHHWYFMVEGLARGVDLTLSTTAGRTNAEVDAALAADPDAVVGVTGGHDPVARLADLWRDDTVADVIYPTAGLSLLQLQDGPFGEACFRVYNDWLAEFCAVDPDRLVGHALVPVWDVDAGVAELERARDAGLRGGIIWTSPPEGDSFFGDRYERLWAAAAALGMPISLHTLAGQRESKALAKWGTTVEDTFYFSFRVRDEMQRSLCELIVSGVFERHPGLRVIGAEGGINYAAMMEQRLDAGYRGFWGHLEHGLTRRPSEYFRECVYLTYISDPIGLTTMRFTGDEHFMWSNDYPHGAASWPNSAETIRKETGEAGLSEETVRRLTFANVAALYGIDADVVAQPSPLLQLAG
jgi:predicted TIM-barrel fold metal-dependent hydrolase